MWATKDKETTAGRGKKKKVKGGKENQAAFDNEHQQEAKQVNNTHLQGLHTESAKRQTPPTKSKLAALSF